MKLFLVLTFLFFSIGSYADTQGSYYSQGYQLRYHLSYTTAPEFHDKLFIYVEGDGDICTEQINRFDDRLPGIKKAMESLTATGNWIYPEKITDIRCAQETRLDGVDFYHRIRQLKDLVKRVQKDLPHIEKIYLMGQSAGPRIAGLTATKLRFNRKIKGVMMAGSSSRRFSILVTNFLLKIGLNSEMDEDFVFSEINDIHQAVRNIRPECSPHKKTFINVIGFIPNDQAPAPEQAKAIRTDNYYCQQDDPHFEDKIRRLLPKRVKVLVMQGDSSTNLDSTEEAIHTYNFLISANKQATLKIVKGMTHNWLAKEHLDEVVNTIRDWSK